MLITQKTVEKMDKIGLDMTKQRFVFNYSGKHRSDLSESHKAIASAEAMDRVDKILKEYSK